MYKIAVMGDQDSIYGFAALGLVPFSITDPQTAEKKLRELAEGGDYAVIYITEALAAKIEPEIRAVPVGRTSGSDPDSGSVREYGPGHYGRKKVSGAGSGIRYHL